MEGSGDPGGPRFPALTPEDEPRWAGLWEQSSHLSSSPSSREMANYKGIQDRSVNRAERLDDLKIFNYQEKEWKLHLEIVSERERFFHLTEEGPPGGDRAEGSALLWFPFSPEQIF